MTSSVIVSFVLDSPSCTGVYGIVLRVKILYNRKDTALVEYSDPQSANNGSVDCFAGVFLLVITLCCLSNRHKQVIYCC